MKHDVVVITPNGKGRHQSDPALASRRARVEARLEAERQRLAEAAEQKAARREADREALAAEISQLKERRRRLGDELAEVRRRLAEATTARNRARALVGDGGDLDDLRAEVADLEREEAEIEGACAILDRELANLDRGATFGGHRVIGG